MIPPAGHFGGSAKAENSVDAPQPNASANGKFQGSPRILIAGHSPRSPPSSRLLLGAAADELQSGRKKHADVNWLYAHVRWISQFHPTTSMLAARVSC